MLRKKVIAVPITKSADAQSDGTLLIRGFFTSDQRDMVGDIITRQATEKAIPAYKQWGNIRRMHLPEPVGKVVRIGAQDGLEWNEVEIKVIDPKAVFEVENGLLQALSIGALVDMSNVSMLEDGGWVINSYALAEISLVDHPANYDAVLQLSLSSAARDLAREHGVDAVLKSLGAQGEPMPKAKEVVVEEKEITETTPAEEQELVDATEVHKDIDEGAEAQVEPEAEEEVVVEEEVEEQPVTEEEVVEEKTVDAEEAPVDPVLAAINALSERIDSISQAVQEMQAKALVAPEQAVREDETSEAVAELKEKNAALQARIDELTLPVDRKALLPVEEKPTEITTEETTAEAEPTDLRTAVRRFISTRTKK